MFIADEVNDKSEINRRQFNPFFKKEAKGNHKSTIIIL